VRMLVWRVARSGVALIGGLIREGAGVSEGVGNWKVLSGVDVNGEKRVGGAATRTA
jgi:hypothetical protein